MILHHDIVFLLLTLRVLPSSVRGATVNWKDSHFSISSQNSGGNGDWQFLFDCPDDKWCGMVICDGTDDISSQVFVGGDAYILARHSLCDCDCCDGLRVARIVKRSRQCSGSV